MVVLDPKCVSLVVSDSYCLFFGSLGFWFLEVFLSGFLGVCGSNSCVV